MNTPARRFTDLIVWQKSHAYVLAVYTATKMFPAHEIYGLTSQMRRAAVSIPANIAEGFKTFSKAEKGRYLTIAQSSLEESRYYLILSHDLNYLDSTALHEQLDEVGKLLSAYRDAIKRDRP